MSVFADLVGQDEAVETLRLAAAAAARIVSGGADGGPSHSGTPGNRFEKLRSQGGTSI